jgi:DNA-directed RNA polymerase subunit RPC12/RpoP
MAMSQSAAQSFPCSNCGAKLQYDAATQGMACPYCGFKQAIQAAPPPPQPGQWGAPQAAQIAGQAPGAIREIPIEEGMRLATRGLGVQVQTINCKECGATVNVGQGERTTECAFCGSKQVLSQATNEQAIRPESLLPFRIPKDEANKRFGTWIGALWFRPSDLKKLAKVQEIGGVYVPFWTFDAQVTSHWSADRGYYYYETEHYTETVNGQTQHRTRQVQRTRWEPASGVRHDGFDDVLVCAGRALPQDLVDKLSTFDTKQLVPYRPEFLAGWRAEAYALDLMPAWGTGQQKIAAIQEGRCAGDIGGDTHRMLNVSNAFAGVTFKHTLLPVWIAAYRYNGKPYRFLVNGQTGEVVGVAPWSVWKITLLVLFLLAALGAIIAIVQSQQQASEPPPKPPAAAAPATPPAVTTPQAPTNAAPLAPPAHAVPPQPSHSGSGLHGLPPSPQHGLTSPKH